MYRDYQDKDVEFYSVYKSLAHPELVGGLIQPTTQQERLQQVKLAQQQLKTTIPWLVDPIDNRFKQAMGNRPNSEFIISPDGTIVVKRAWSHPGETRKDLERLVGKAESHTRVADLNMNIELPRNATEPPHQQNRIARDGMQSLVCESLSTDGIQYAKLRVEASPQALREKTGKVYLGFHLDPLHHAHWNNLTAPLSWSLSLPQGIQVKSTKETAEKRAIPSDSEPREFILEVDQWDTDQPAILTVSYVACVGQECIPVQQRYRIFWKRDPDGGSARGLGAGTWEAREFFQNLLRGDENGDGKLSPDEVIGLIRPHFAALDANGNQLLDADEIEKITEWLNDPQRAFESRSGPTSGDSPE